MGYRDKDFLTEEGKPKFTASDLAPLLNPTQDIPVLSSISRGIGATTRAIDNALPTTPLDKFIMDFETLANFTPGIGDLETGKYSPVDILGVGLDAVGIGAGIDWAIQAIKRARVDKATKRGIDWVRKWNRHPESQRRRTMDLDRKLSRQDIEPLPFNSPAIIDLQSKWINYFAKTRNVREDRLFYHDRLERPINITYFDDPDIAWGGIAYRRGSDIEDEIKIKRVTNSGKTKGEGDLWGVESIAVHEGDHIARGGLWGADRDQIVESLNKEGLAARARANEGVVEKERFGPQYLSRPLEINARIKQLRHWIGWKSFDDVPVITRNYKLPDKVKKHWAYNELVKVVKEDKIKDLMLNLSGFAPVIPINKLKNKEDKMYEKVFGAPEGIMELEDGA